MFGTLGLGGDFTFGFPGTLGVAGIFGLLNLLFSLTIFAAPSNFCLASRLNTANVSPSLSIIISVMNPIGFPNNFNNFTIDGISLENILISIFIKTGIAPTACGSLYEPPPAPAAAFPFPFAPALSPPSLSSVFIPSII